ncbi:AMP-binding protein [Ramlibacter terrae]|uniref:AMP-binding protein n=1 Tax=Ramlibacter terrae TaxID=2732511 RepID=A0ABX6P229_9BURK|nr:AMP-binding protein [Ramlibacter terrae]
MPHPVPPGVRFHLTDVAFARQLAQPLGAERPQWSPLELHEPQRITRTSGSSGRSKFMLLARAAQEQWVATGTEKLTYVPGARLLVLAPFVTNGALARSSACLRRGAMVIGGGTGATVAELAPTHIWGLPAHVERLLRELPPGYTSPRPVDVATVGGVMAPSLRQEAARVFGGWIKNRYGSNEVGGICEEIGTDGVGLLCAGAEVRILAPDGSVLPPGETGTIAVRTSMMASGYLDLPDDTAASFRDGWFVSSDVGAIVGHRRLRLLGRKDDLVNIGGSRCRPRRWRPRSARSPPSPTARCRPCTGRRRRHARRGAGAGRGRDARRGRRADAAGLARRGRCDRARAGALGPAAAAGRQDRPARAAADVRGLGS